MGEVGYIQYKSSKWLRTHLMLNALILLKAPEKVNEGRIIRLASDKTIHTAEQFAFVEKSGTLLEK